MIGEPKTSKSSGGNNPLEQFILLGKTAKGAAAAELLQQAMEAPGIYAFGQLIDMENIRELANGEHKKYWDLVNIFAYGTYKDYIQNRATLPELTTAQKRKLQYLTIVTLSEKNKCIPYETLQKELDIPTVRLLEDLIIEAIYADIMEGKLDQSQGLLEIDTTIGRDLRPSDINAVVTTLESWCDACDNILATLNTEIDKANAAKTARIQRKEALEQEIANLKKTVKTQTQDTEDMVTDSREAMGIEKTPKKTVKKGVKSSSRLGMFNK